MRCSACFGVCLFALLNMTGSIAAQATSGVKERFERLDLDRDGNLISAEFLKGVAEKDRPIMSREFQLVDFNGDSVLTIDEFASVIGIPLGEFQRVVPDGLVQLTTTVTADLQERFARADDDADGKLTIPQWSKIGFSDKFHELARLAPEIWDLDRDGSTDMAEVTRFVQVAFGLQLVSGEATHSDDGIHFNWPYLQAMDKNRDNKLSLEEFANSFHLGAEESTKQFKLVDKDGDGFGTILEMRRLVAVVPLNEFRRIDTNLDARLDALELAKGTRTFEAGLPPFLLPAFDADQDGFLSFREYQMTPAAQPMGHWFREIVDKDGDGIVSIAEFQSTLAPFGVALGDRFFTTLDRNHDGKLSYDEYRIKTDPVNLPRSVVFQLADVDQSGSVSLSEIFRHKLAADANVGTRRSFLTQKLQCEAAFAMADADANGEVTLAEFQAGVWGVESFRAGTQATRVRLPDPMLAVVARLDSAIPEVVRRHDSNADGHLDSDEWSKVNWTELHPLAPSPLVWWDKDQNGAITPEEWAQGLLVAFCQQDSSGTLLREDDGAIFNLSYFSSMDSNHDGWLTRDEFTKGYYLGREKSAERFDQIDKESKGRMTFAEMRTIQFRSSALDGFLNYDVNLDGRIERDELLARSRPDQKTGAARIFPGFDKDGDGLSLTEYRESPLADESVSWNHVPNDEDRDGVLTAAEFRPTKGLLASGLSDTFFRRLDLNHDGKLSYSECPFTTDPLKLPRDVLFQQADLDHNGTVSIADIFRHKLPADANSGAKRAWLAQKLQCEAAFAKVDADENNELTLVEFQASDWGVAAFRAGTTGTRGRIPDPMTEVIARLSLSIADAVKRHDLNSDGQLDPKEWAKLSWPDLLPLAPSPWEWWDTDHSGAISSDEWIRGLQVAFCMEDANGIPLRSDDASIFNLNYFSAMDSNRDGWLTRDEFAKGYYLGPEKSVERFDQIDKEAKGKMTFAEMRMIQFHSSALDGFLHYDANLDGRIERDELLAKSRPDQRTGAERIFPAFDANRDGALSFMEYRGSPLADESVGWGGVLNDADRNGVLTPAEIRPKKGLLASGLSDAFFRSLDLNRDGAIQFDECRFTTDPSKLPREVLFHEVDRDHDGTVTYAEIFQHKLAAEANAGAKRNHLAQQLQCEAAFAKADADGNKELTLAEFQASDWGVEAYRAGTTGNRVRIPDPMTDVIARLSLAIPAVMERHDRNRDGHLSSNEWAQVGWQELAPLAPSPLAWWDRDQDGTITAEEWSRGLPVAFSIEDPHGITLRGDDGSIFNLSYFSSMDSDHDGSLTRAEFAKGYYLGPEKSAERFDQIDPESKGAMTFAEMRMIQFRGSALDGFLHYDANLDGRIERDELFAKSRPDQRTGAERIFPGFDADRDGALSFMEYRGSPLADESVGWGFVPNDVNRDGLLTPEEFRPGKSLLACALSDTFFRSLDLNHNGTISHDECRYSTDLGKLPRDFLFSTKDANTDGNLTFEEVFLDKRPAADKLDALRWYLNKLLRSRMAFRATDGDGNNVLSLDEFQRGEFAGTCLSESSGGPIPDPIRRLVDSTIESVFKTSTDTLSKSAWSGLESISPDLADLKRTDADQDRDGSVTRDELRRILEVAYGVCLPDGTLIRQPAGDVFNYPYFVALDTDQNGKLSRQEFVSKHYSGPDAAAKLFAEADKDQDGSATIGELLPGLRYDRIGMFLNFDKNLDGQIFPEELMERSQKWEQNMAMSVFPAFDQDNDGSLSFEEFELCPFPNRVRDWNRTRRDDDFDALLSYREFRLDDKLFASALTHRFFRVLDQNHDGSLSYNEFRFDMDVSKVSAEVAFQIQDKDRNNKLSFQEVFQDPKPTPEDKDAVERYEMRLGAAETRFLADDVDRDGVLSVAEFQRSKDSALAAVERKTKALSRQRGRQASNLPFTLFLILDGVLLAGLGWFVFKWTGRRKSS